MLQILNAEPVSKAVLNPAGRTGGIVHVLITRRKLEKNLLTSIQSMFCFVSIAARHVSSLFRAESNLSCKGEVPPMLASEEGSGVQFFHALQAAGGGYGQCLPLTGNGITALNCLILWEKGVNGTLRENFQCLLYHRSCYLATVAGASGTLHVGPLLTPSCAAGQPLTPRLALCAGTSWPACLGERLMSFARFKEGVGFIVVKSFQWTKEVS